MIIDTDKSSDDRMSPSVKHPDQLDRRTVMAKGTNSTNYVSPASTQSALTGGKNGQFTIVQSGTYTPVNPIVTTNPGAGNFVSDNFTIYTQAHGLSFVPAVMGYVAFGNGSTYAPMPYFSYAAPTTSQCLWVNLSVYVDATNIYLYGSTMSYGSNFSITLAPFKWYLLQQTSN